MNELVSLIVPVYNVKDYLERCVSSLLNQTYDNIEILIIDDGSTDGSGDICNILSEKDMRIDVTHQNNGGISLARNNGIKKAKGKYICFIDSDDWVEQNYVEKLYSFASENECDIVCCGMYKTYDDKDKIIFTQYKNEIYEKDEALKKLFHYKLMDYAGDKIYRANLFKNVSFPVGMYCEDMGTTYKLFFEASKIGTVNEVMYNYYQRNGSLVHVDKPYKREDIFYIFKKRYEFFSEYFDITDFSTEKELVKLALAVLKIPKKKRNKMIAQEALNVLKEYNNVPAGMKDRILYCYYKYLIQR